MAWRALRALRNASWTRGAADAAPQRSSGSRLRQRARGTQKPGKDGLSLYSIDMSFIMVFPHS